MNRDHTLLSIRPVIPGLRISDLMRSDEQFQNLTLRPVINLQSDLLMAVFNNYIAKHKNVFYDLSPERKRGLYRECRT